MRITIDGTVCECQKDEVLLNVARRNDIFIPTLCHHDALTGQGCCRLCIVEITGRDRTKVVTACLYPVSEEIAVVTNSQRLIKHRRMILAFLRWRAPDSELIAQMCEYFDAPDLPVAPVESGKCILCGLCVRACNEIGAGAITSAKRGTMKEITTPYHEPAVTCIGCGSCARICPTGEIVIVETANTRTIWGKEFDLVVCEDCGEMLGTANEIQTVAKRTDLEPDFLCPVCRQKRMADSMKHTFSRVGLE